MILGIVQARMGSTRLPGKAIKKIGEMPLVEIVRQRAERANMLDKVVVSTTGAPEDLLIKADFREPLPRDPLGGFYACAANFGADIIVRITADDPLKEPALIDEAVSYMLQRPGLGFPFQHSYPYLPMGARHRSYQIQHLKVSA